MVHNDHRVSLINVCDYCGKDIGLSGVLYLLRHGESAWNQEDRFTGWADVPLTPQGEEEMREISAQLRGIRIDHVYTSSMQRTLRSADIILESLGLAGKVPVTASSELNERFYGELEGQNKKEAATRYGVEQVRIWRRSYEVAPPGGESLRDAAARILPYTLDEILPRVHAGNNVLLCTHGNTLRVIRMYLDGLTPEAIMKLEIANGELIRYPLQSP